MLVAARDDLPQPSVGDYYPAMKRYYEALPAQAQSGVTLYGAKLEGLTE
jgi:hypothetical protein